MAAPSSGQVQSSFGLIGESLSDDKIPRARDPKVWVILHRPQLEQSNTYSFEKKKRKKNPKERHPRWSAVDSLLNRDIDAFILLWELSEDAEPEYW